MRSSCLPRSRRRRNGLSLADCLFRAAVCLAILLVGRIGLAAEEASGDTAAKNDEDRLYDCGLLALYSFLRSEGLSADLSELEGRLPGSTPHGRSLHDLIVAAEGLGLDLKAVRTSGPPDLPRRTCLAYLRRGEHGHYVILRPVGHSGRLLQVLDGPLPPTVVDAADYCRSDGWTGIVLLRAEHPHQALATKLATASLLVLPLSLLVILSQRAIASRRGSTRARPLNL